jgi:hypothetical protein
LTDEDVAFAAAQYGSGITQREIAATFGYANSSTICVRIDEFARKYIGAPSWAAWANDRERKALLRLAVATFVAERIRREMET